MKQYLLQQTPQEQFRTAQKAEKMRLRAAENTAVNKKFVVRNKPVGFSMKAAQEMSESKIFGRGAHY